jgi:hypothetical protein
VIPERGSRRRFVLPAILGAARFIHRRLRNPRPFPDSIYAVFDCDSSPAMNLSRVNLTGQRYRQSRGGARSKGRDLVRILVDEASAEGEASAKCQPHISHSGCCDAPALVPVCFGVSPCNEGCAYEQAGWPGAAR